MTNKDFPMSTYQRRRTSNKAKVKLSAAKSVPVCTSRPVSKERRLRTKQVHPKTDGCVDASRCRIFPNEEPSVDKHCWDNNPMNIGVIDTAAEPYLVPITTKTFTSQNPTESAKASGPKKVALLPRPEAKQAQDIRFSRAQSLRERPISSPQTRSWEEFIKTKRPIPPPKIVSRKESEPEADQSKTKEQPHLTQGKLSKVRRRDLAYLVVDLTSDPSFRFRKKSFDDLDVPLKYQSEREERKSLTRSFTMSIPGDQLPRNRRFQRVTDSQQDPLTSQDDQNLIKTSSKATSSLTTKLDKPTQIPPLPPKRTLNKMLSLQPDTMPTGKGMLRRSMPPRSKESDDNTDGSESVNSLAFSDLSSDAFLSSTELLNDPKLSHNISRVAPSKPTPYSEHKKKRRTPPPPPRPTSPPVSGQTIPSPPSFPPPSRPPPLLTYTSTLGIASPSQGTISDSITSPQTYSMNQIGRRRSSSLSGRRKQSVEVERKSTVLLKDDGALFSASTPNLKAEKARSPRTSFKSKPAQLPPRPPPLNTKLQQKVKDIKQTGQLTTTATQHTGPLKSRATHQTGQLKSTTTQQHKRIRPVISNPQLISSTKSIPGKPISGPHRHLPNPPPVCGSLPASLHGFPTDDYSEDGPSSHYEIIDMSVPVRPPRRKTQDMMGMRMYLSETGPALPPKSVKTDPIPRRRLSSQKKKSYSHPLVTEKRSADSTNSGDVTKITDFNALSNVGQDRPISLRSISSPEPSGVPEEYIEPHPTGGLRDTYSTNNDALLGNGSVGEENDEPGEDYVDMGSVQVSNLEIADIVGKAWSEDSKDDFDQDLPEDSYVEMHPVGDPYKEDQQEPIYIEMNPKEFIKPPPPEKTESLYYATKDLLFLRPDLTVEKHSKSKGNRS